jgi:phosphatidylglycerophosphate synthase
MRSRIPGREAILLVLTVMRLGLGCGLCVAVWQQASPYASLAWLIAILITDMGDGVVARWLSVDTNLRRIVDVVVDRISIHAAFAVIVWRIPGTLPLVLPIVIRDIVLILRNCWLFQHKRIIITPGIIHRAGTFLYAVVGGVVLFTTGPIAQWVSNVAAVVVWFLLLDYLRAGSLAPAHPEYMPVVRYQAVGLRALRGITPPQRSATGN